MLRLILLSAFLLLSQGGLLLHGLDVDHDHASHQQCDICIKANGLEGPVANASAQLVPPSAHSDTSVDLTSQIISRSDYAYHTRAPPRA